MLGRLTYEIFAAYWPHAIPYDEGDAVKPAEGKEDPAIIQALNERLKLVFSTTLDEPAWQNTRVIRGGLEDEIRRQKLQPGKAINIQGSASIVQALGRADLIDEYQLYVHPVLLGPESRSSPAPARTARTSSWPPSSRTRTASSACATGADGAGRASDRGVGGADLARRAGRLAR